MLMLLCWSLRAFLLESLYSSTSAHVHAASYKGCPWSAQAAWLTIFCGYYSVLCSEPVFTTLEKWDLDSRELQGQTLSNPKWLHNWEKNGCKRKSVSSYTHLNKIKNLKAPDAWTSWQSKTQRTLGLIAITSHHNLFGWSSSHDLHEKNRNYGINF